MYQQDKLKRQKAPPHLPKKLFCEERHISSICSLSKTQCERISEFHFHIFSDFIGSEVTGIDSIKDIGKMSWNFS